MLIQKYPLLHMNDAASPMIVLDVNWNKNATMFK